MTEITPPASTSTHRFYFKQLPAFLIHPRQGMESLAAREKPAWIMPMLVFNITFLLTVLVSGYIQAHAAALGQAALPADWQWWTTDMQNNYMSAIQATQGPVFVYIIPLVIGLARLWLVWAVVSGMLHLLSTLMGGRGTMRSALNVVAWAGLVFALRDLLRVFFMLLARHTITSPGLSGLSSTLFVSKLLESVDLFLVWYAFLLIVGLVATDNLPVKKSIATVTIVLMLLVLVQAGLGTLSASLGGMMITRPF
jgi:hypothetical protein